MKRKLLRFIGLFVLSIIFGVLIYYCDNNDFGIGEAIFGALICLSIEKALCAFQDFFDVTYWKTTQRKLKRGGLLSDSTQIRISFAYLYRIKVGNKYLLVQNSRNTRKYQPVGGVYKMSDAEKMELKNRFHIIDDDKIKIDEISRNDYRLQLENRYLRKFVKRFDKKAEREKLDNLGREFKEELIDNGILDWKQIKYRICGRQMSDLIYGNRFQTFELLLADVVELIPTREQESDLKSLMNQQSEKYIFATSEQINSYGINTGTGQLFESIADHSNKILQETEESLMHIPKTGSVFSVRLDIS